jgi:hypothetical protein
MYQNKQIGCEDSTAVRYVGSAVRGMRPNVWDTSWGSHWEGDLRPEETILRSLGEGKAVALVSYDT